MSRNPSIDKDKQSKGLVKQILATIIACIASVSFGFSTQYSSQSIPQLRNKLLGDLYLTDSDTSLFGVSIYLSFYLSLYILN